MQRPAVRPVPNDTDGTGPLPHEDLADRTDPVPALTGATDPKLEPDITFTMTTGGTIAAETNDTCTNTLTLQKATTTELTFNEPGNDQCVAGTVTLTLRGSTLAYLWTDGIEQNTATLHRKSGR